MTLFGLILRVLLCSAVLYGLATLVTSLTRLLPFLALGSSIALILTARSVVSSPDVQSKIWILMVLTIATVFFHRGKDYMEPHVVKNVFGVVDVRRRWVRMFASDDEFVIYLAPKTVGGFFENTFFLGICYYFYYAVICSPYASWAVYIPVIYYLSMAVLEILIVIGYSVGILHDFPTVLYWIVRLAVLITALIIGLSGGSDSTGGVDRKLAKKAERLIEQCGPLAVLNYEDSYRVSTDYRKIGGDAHSVNFLYDADLEAGGLYRDNGDSFDFYTVFARDLRLGGIARFEQDTWDKSVYRFDRLVTKQEGHPRPFDPEQCGTYTTYDIPALCALTKEKLLHVTQIKEREQECMLQILYASRNDSSVEQPLDYQVNFTFHTDKSGKAVSLYSIYCEIYMGDYQYDFIYYPLQGETPLASLFDRVSHTLLGYHASEDTSEEILTTEQKLKKAIDDVLAAAREGVGAFDFSLRAWERDRQGKTQDAYCYAYDAGVQVSAMYGEDDYDAGMALELGDFESFPADAYISNPHRAMYDSNYARLPDVIPFARFTGDKAKASDAIRYAFDVELYFDIGDIEVNADQTITLNVKPSGNEVHGGEYFAGRGYEFRFEQRGEELALVSIWVFLEREERDIHGTYQGKQLFEMILYVEDFYRIPAP